MPVASNTDRHLTNLPRTHNLTSGSALPTNFSTTLSSLITSSSTAQPPRKKARTGKDDIFTTHNRNTSARAARDLDPSNTGPFAQKHSTKSEAVGKDVLERSRRKMEQKARIYKALKKGEIEDEEERFEVDFDGERRSDDDTSEDDAGEAGEEVEYIDEFGRTRKGTRLDALKAQQSTSSREKEDDRFTARPAAPSSGVVYGDAIQHEAFDPDAGRVRAMAELAKKRDRSLTPPPEEFYDAGKEVRTRGTGFMKFSGEKEEREEQMRGLEQLRRETEGVRGEGGSAKGRNEVVEARKKIMEERKRVIEEKRARRKAEEFLGGLAKDMDGGSGDGGGSADMADRIEDAIRREGDAEQKEG